MTAAARALFGAMRLCRNRKLHKLRSGSHAFMPADLCELLDHTVTALPLAAHLHSVDKRPTARSELPTCAASLGSSRRTRPGRSGRQAAEEIFSKSAGCLFG